MIIFIHLAKLLGYLVFFFGLMTFIVGLLNSPEDIQHYFKKSSGELIDNGVKYIVFGVILGALGEIGKAVIKKSES